MSNYFFTPEQAALYGVACTVWRRRGTAKARRLQFSEESITDTILMDLAETYPGSLTILPFTKYQEGRRGADWAWLFRDASGRQNLPMLVQAKALDFRDLEYREIKRLVGETDKRQIDLLIENSELLGWPAIYMFYNHLSDAKRIPLNRCPSLLSAGPNVSLLESWGISLADAYAVRSVLDDQTFDTHRIHSSPFHCLLCSGGSGQNLGSPLLALRTLERLAVDPRERLLRLLDRAPPLFERALEIVRDDHISRSAKEGGLERDFPSLAGVAVFQDSE